MFRESGKRVGSATGSQSEYGIVKVDLGALAKHIEIVHNAKERVVVLRLKKLRLDYLANQGLLTATKNAVGVSVDAPVPEWVTQVPFDIQLQFAPEPWAEVVRRKDAFRTAIMKYKQFTKVLVHWKSFFKMHNLDIAKLFSETDKKHGYFTLGMVVGVSQMVQNASNKRKFDASERDAKIVAATKFFSDHGMVVPANLSKWVEAQKEIADKSAAEK